MASSQTPAASASPRPAISDPRQVPINEILAELASQDPYLKSLMRLSTTNATSYDQEQVFNDYVIYVKAVLKRQKSALQASFVTIAPIKQMPRSYASEAGKHCNYCRTVHSLHFFTNLNLGHQREESDGACVGGQITKILKEFAQSSNIAGTPPKVCALAAEFHRIWETKAPHFARESRQSRDAEYCEALRSCLSKSFEHQRFRLSDLITALSLPPSGHIVELPLQCAKCAKIRPRNYFKDLELRLLTICIGCRADDFVPWLGQIERTQGFNTISAREKALLRTQIRAPVLTSSTTLKVMPPLPSKSELASTGPRTNPGCRKRSLSETITSTPAFAAPTMPSKRPRLIVVLKVKHGPKKPMKSLKQTCPVVVIEKRTTPVPVPEKEMYLPDAARSVPQKSDFTNAAPLSSAAGRAMASAALTDTTPQQESMSVSRPIVERALPSSVNIAGQTHDLTIFQNQELRAAITEAAMVFGPRLLQDLSKATTELSEKRLAADYQLDSNRRGLIDQSSKKTRLERKLRDAQAKFRKLEEERLKMEEVVAEVGKEEGVLQSKVSKGIEQVNRVSL